MKRNVEETISTKKGKNWIITLLACVVTGVMVFLIMYIGQNSSKKVDSDTNKSNNNEVICEEVECNCAENTNTDSNDNSNTTTQPTKPATTYTTASLKGTYKFEGDTYTITYILSDNGLFVQRGNYKNAGGSVTYGNYVVENNTIKLHSMIEGSIGIVAVDKVVTANIVSANTISIDNKTYKKTNNDYSDVAKSWSHVTADYANYVNN